MVTVVNESIENTHHLANTARMLQEKFGENWNESKMDEESLEEPVLPEPCKSVNVAIQLHRRAERFFEAVNNRPSGKVRVDEVERASEMVHEATRALCRALRLDPVAVEHLSNFDTREEAKGKEGNEYAMDEVSQLLSELRKCLLSSISTTVEQEQARQEFAKELKARTKQAEDDLETLKEAFQEEVHEREMESQYYSDIAHKLQTELAEMRNANDIETQTLVEETKKWAKESIKQHDESKAKAIETLTKLEEKHEMVTTEHGDLEESLRKKVSKVQTEVKSLILNYDENLGDRLAELQMIELQYEHETNRLAELEEHFRKVDRDLANEAAELKIIAEEQAKIDAAKKELDDAAARIQALYRGNKLRKGKKPKGKKKGKGKKGKGKKKK